MQIRRELKQEIKKEILAYRELNEIDKARQLNKIEQKKRKDDLEFDRDLKRLNKLFAHI